MEPKNRSNDRMLTPLEAAKVLGTQRNYIYRLIKKGELPSKKIGGADRRIWESDLYSWIENQPS